MVFDIGYERSHYTPHVFLPSDGTVGDAVRAYVDRGGGAWWLLVTQVGGQYRVCSYGSLLPYLTGRTPHIVHNLGDCAICSGMDPLLWQETDSLVDEVVVNERICSRRLSELPMADLPILVGDDAGKETPDRAWTPGPAFGITFGGELEGVYVERTKGLDAMPVF